MNWLHYLLEANLYLGVFYLGYYLFLSRETYYTLNRVYLLFSCVVSFALPVLQLGILKPVEQPVTAVNFTFTTYPTTFVPVAPIEAHPAFTWQDVLVYGYILGAMILLIVLTIKLISLYRLTRRQNLDADGKFKLVYLDQSATAFSFFNYLFIGTKVQGSETIIRHELVHIRQKHSADIIFIELLKIVNWFNPFIYFIQYSLKTIHEYIADEQTAVDALAYSSFLVNNAYGLGGSSITHSFFNYNLLKKRIIMLHQKRSGSLARLKYLVAVPICAGLLCASTLAFSKSYGWVDIGPHRIDKNNKSPQVPEPKRSLLVRQHGLSYLTDKFSYKRPDGSTRIYTGYNLSNKDAVDLAKKGIQIDVIYDTKVETVDTKKLTFLRNDTAKHIAPPPLPAQPMKVVIAPDQKNTLIKTSKGYKYTEQVFVADGKTDMKVEIFAENKDVMVFDKNKISADQIKILKEKYGYVFPAHFRMPPPPPAPPAPKVVRFPPPKVIPGVNYTSKGYKFTEDGYLINGKTDYRVIITEKDGNQHEYFKSRASDADIKKLSEKYGYTFPTMQIYTKLPPPPPEPPAGPEGIDKRPPPPPPAPPKTGMITPKGKTIKAKEPVLQVDSDALGRMDMMIVVHKKAC
jgi:hypothetical protein